MFCTSCGREIDDDAIYCNYCGKKTINEENVIEYDIINDIKDIDISSLSIKICVILLTIVLIKSIIDIITIYIIDKNINIGQAIFMIIFMISIISILKSNKIGIAALITFISFKIISSIYYHFQNSEYLLRNLIVDEIFYVILIILCIIGWKKLNYNRYT